ncbi:MAG TPA: class I adenylate cyclase [Deltaproteobacteria bacterium]|nr:class I adenylate cyclase [Deltaproteobacteria bacterium]
MGSHDQSITRALREFSRYNALKKRRMYDCDPVSARVILEFLPLLLHINHPALPGFVDDACPCGIMRFDWGPEKMRETGAFFSSRLKVGDLRQFLPDRRLIEGIYTIGSSGSLAQTRESDFDVWVVVDSEKTGKDGMEMLRRKIRMIQRFISTKFVLDIHFFLMDLEDIRKNDFGSVSQEGSGSALKTILKEEFYRTMTIVEGCVPLWWVVQAGRGRDAYEEARRAVLTKKEDAGRIFVDMGDLQGIPEHELMGAALWQMHKALDDPLKSVLKMALLVSYLDASGVPELLCDRLKREVHENAAGRVIDPYLHVLRRLEEHYLEQDDPKTVDLLRKCFYLKVNPQIKPMDLVKAGGEDKAAAMAEVVHSWGWSMHAVKNLNGFSQWGVERYRVFGDEIHSFLRQSTVKIIRSARSFMVSGTSIDDDIEVEVLRRRIEAFYVTKKGKIEAERRVKKREPAYRDIYFAYGKGRWCIYDSAPEAGQRPIVEAKRVVGVLAWLVYNKRFDASTSFHMVPNPTGVALSDIQSLMKTLSAVIPDAASIGLDRTSLMEDRYPAIMVVIGNMECPEVRHHIREIDVVYMNTWKELFCEYMSPDHLKGWVKRTRRPGTEIRIWLPKEAVTSGLTFNLSRLLSP